MSILTVGNFVKVSTRVGTTTLTTKKLSLNEIADCKDTHCFDEGEVFLIRECEIITEYVPNDNSLTLYVSVLHATGIYWIYLGISQYIFEKL